MARRRTGFQKKIEVVHWTYGSFEFVQQAATAAAQTVLSAQHLPETLLRIRGEWAATFASALGDGVGSAATIGLILVPEGTGSTVLWSPITDGDAPWIWWDVIHLLYREFVSDVNYSTQTSSGRRVIDSKAMRKVRNTELQVVVENPGISGLSGGTADMVGSIRSLHGS